VLIYFNRQTQVEIINKSWHVLRPGGYLLLGHSETLHGMDTPFRYIAPAVYRKDIMIPEALCSFSCSYSS